MPTDKCALLDCPQDHCYNEDCRAHMDRPHESYFCSNLCKRIYWGDHYFASSFDRFKDQLKKTPVQTQFLEETKEEIATFNEEQIKSFFTS